MDIVWFIKHKLRKLKHSIADLLINMHPKSYENITRRNKILLALTSQRYVIQHKANGNVIDVSIYDIVREEYININFASIYYQKPRWWNASMNDTSYITVWSPTTEEKEIGITFAHKVRTAYTKLQVLADNLIAMTHGLKKEKRAIQSKRRNACKSQLTLGKVGARCADSDYWHDQNKSS